MAILLRIAKNTMPVSTGIYLVILLLVTVSFNTMKAFMPLSQAAKDSPITEHAHKIVTMLPIMFSSYELGAILVSAILVDFGLSRKCTLMSLLVVWIIGPSLLCSTHLQTNFLFLFRLTAIFRGVLETILFSMGAQPYQSEDTNLIYVYVICNYCMYQLGSGMAQVLLPPNIVESSVCGDYNCVKRAALYASACAAAACILYACYLSYPRDDNAPKKATDTQLIKSESYKFVCIIVVLIPYGVFWVYYQQVIPQLSALPNLINLFVIRSDAVPVLYKVLTLIVAYLFYMLIYQWCSEFILRNATLFMTIGGVLLGLCSIYGAALVDATDGQYVQTKADAIRVTYVCPRQENGEFMDIPYYKSSGCNRGVGPIIVHNDQELVTRQDNICPWVWVDYWAKYTHCLHGGRQYLWYICDGFHSFIMDDPYERDPYGKPVLCVLQQNSWLCDTYDNYNPFIILYKEPNKTHDAVQYTFTSYKFKANGDTYPDFKVYECRTVLSGSYYLVTEYVNEQKVVHFDDGGVYLISYNCNLNYNMAVLINPYQFTILNCRLIPLYVIRAIGEFLLVTNGFYFVCTQVNPKFRTIAIGIWFMFIKFGPLMYDIQRMNNIYFRISDLNHLGHVLIFTAILFYIIHLVLNCRSAPN